MCPSGVTCLPTHLFSLLDTNNFISEGGRGVWDFFMSVSRSFKHQVDQKYFLYIHEVKDTYIRDLKNNCVLSVTSNPVKKVR
jgi:hypothetical protein